MLQFSATFQKRLRVEVRKSPLANPEIRRVVGLGNLRMSLIAPDDIERGWQQLYSLKIEGLVHHFYRYEP
jgi:hypothetical protein